LDILGCSYLVVVNHMMTANVVMIVSDIKIIQTKKVPHG